MSKIPVLQSGFLSFSNERLVKPEIYKNSIIDVMLGKEYRTGNNVNFYSDEVVALYGQWSGDAALLTNFEFREKVIKAAMRSFGGRSIWNWCSLQKDTPNLTTLHERFILDTLNFVGGKPREIQTTQWLRLIEINTQPNGVSLDVDRYFNPEARRSIHDDRSSYTYLPASLPNFLKQWLAQVGGFEDLLISLQVIFGNRPYPDDVSRKIDTGIIAS